MNTVPVTVLTGFLGAGKTTLLNRILTAHHGQRVAVIENEFGEVGVDQDLVNAADEEIFEMNNGCLCCTVRGDLIRILGQLMKRRDKFDVILIETTGMADPGPVAQTFFMDDELRAKTRLDAIVTVVDAKHVLLHWDSHEVQEQVAFADVVLLNKCDLVTEKELKHLEMKIRFMNAAAAVHRTTNAEIAMAKILNINGFNLDRVMEREPEFLMPHDHVHDHTHDQSVSSVGFDLPGDCDAKQINTWMANLLQSKGQDIFRMKGVLSLKGDSKRFVFQGVHMTFDGRPDKPWGNTPRANKLIFIGRNLDREELRRGLEACLVS